MQKSKTTTTPKKVNIWQDKDTQDGQSSSSAPDGAAPQSTKPPRMDCPADAEEPGISEEQWMYAVNHSLQNLPVGPEGPEESMESRMWRMYPGQSSSSATGGAAPPSTKPPRIGYPSHAEAPRTSEEHSIYPVNHRLQKASVAPEEPMESRMYRMNPGQSSSSVTGGATPQSTKPPRTDYPAHADTPATSEEHSIYPMNSRLQKAPVAPEEGMLSRMNRIYPGMLDSRDPRFNFQYQVRMDLRRLEAEKWSKMPYLISPPTSNSGTAGRPDQQIVHQSNQKVKTRNTRTMTHESVDLDDAAEPEELDRDFTMFEDTPRDQSIIPERAEWDLPPWDQSEPPQPPSLASLSSMTVWDPDIDPEFQTESQWNLEKWNDCRFKVPETPEDIDSLQQALEITRMDFWIKDPYECYPDEYPQYKTESYGSQHRRLQHTFRRIGQGRNTVSAPELYRLPAWTFGFERCYWQPSTWGVDERSNAYVQGLVDMAAEKNEKGLQGVDYRSWKAKLEQLIGAKMTTIDQIIGTTMTEVEIKQADAEIEEGLIAVRNDALYP